MKAMTLFAASAALIAFSVPAHADAIDGETNVFMADWVE